MGKFKFLGIIFFVLTVTVFAGCSSNKTEVAVQEESIAPVQEIPEQEVPVVVAEEVKAEIVQPVDNVPEVVQDAEYLRSIATVSSAEEISVDTFNQDKKDILELIDQIDQTMQSNNYNKWLSYVVPESKVYWQNRNNLNSIQERLPVKVKISSMQDYFKYVFVPSRAGRNVDEIRYVSSSLVKAVQVKDNRDIIYYTFEKIDGKWMLKLDTLS
ncbi:MAG: hypothetical protein J6B81_02865 [Spirochaetaceae bacterium]|nr:hypothetical protein [Spirochaetaceae bacterium]